MTTDLNNPAHIGHSNYLISTDGKRAEQILDSKNPLSKETIEKLLNELNGHYLERCGFIDNKGKIHSVRNVHHNPRKNFYMEEDDAEEVLRYIYQESKSYVIGIYHTHPNGYPWPTPRDIAGWPNVMLNWRYFLVSRDQVTEWKLVNDVS